MQLKTKIVAVAAITAVSIGLSPKSTASSLRTTTKSSSLRTTTQPKPMESPVAEPEYRIHLHHLHTGEDLDIVYRVGDNYLPTALEQLNHFLRDHRTQDVSNYDPREFDVLHELMASLGRPNGVIDIVCGYRTPWSNNFLRTRSASTGVAEHSQHMLAKAIDIRVPGVSTLVLRNAALALHAGGVGFYPVSQFVHVDVGPVRQWSFR
ncbi:MAG TPA: DUF882 domain-containing protein [Acidobacteriaceae bacterium]|jgi:uncharacterized protein YcbK (DUF882 family)|nr:DUF882 domain-containing protein [Acidobacteriaceae bacterium]